MKKTLLFLCLIAFGAPLLAQIDPLGGYQTRAVLFSNSQFGGTARIQGLAGANTALGGDLTSTYSNPAGLGFFRRSQASIGIGAGVHSSESEYFNPLDGTNTFADDSKSNLHINQLGAAFAHQPKSLSAFKGGAFAISLTRLQDFNDRYTYEAVSETENQYVDYLLSQANGNYTLQELFNDGVSNGFEILFSDPVAMGFWTYLINPVFDENTLTTEDTLQTNQYFTPVELVPTVQREEIETSGSHNEFSASYGGNVDDRFYFGFGLGLQWANFVQERTYSERPVADNDVLELLTYRDRLQVDMVGVNLKAGVIARPHDYILLGLSYQSPTWSSVSERYDATLNANYNNFPFNDPIIDSVIVLDQESARTGELEGSYSLRTPQRVSGGLTVFIAKYGFVSATAEWVDYASAKLSNPDLGPNFSFDFANGLIEDELRSVLNLRFGAEGRIKKKFLIRAGYALHPSPYRVNTDVDSKTQFFTGGLGYRGKNFALDFALVRSTFEEAYSPYPVDSFDVDGNLVPIEPVVRTMETNWRGQITFTTFW